MHLYLGPKAQDSPLYHPVNKQQAHHVVGRAGRLTGDSSSRQVRGPSPSSLRGNRPLRDKLMFGAWLKLEKKGCRGCGRTTSRLQRHPAVEIPGLDHSIPQDASHSSGHV